MPLVDFAAWATPTLDIPLGGRIYQVRPPSVADARLILACVARSEVTLGLVPGPIPDDLAEVLATIGDTPLALITLGRHVYDQMAADEVPAADIDRVGYYAMHYWARGRARADLIAEALWVVPADAGAGEPAPKARPRKRSTNGRSTG